MSSFAVSDCLDTTQHAGYQRFAVLLSDFSDPNFLDYLFSALGSCLYATLSFIIALMFLIGLRYGLFPGHSSTEILLCLCVCLCVCGVFVVVFFWFF